MLKIITTKHFAICAFCGEICSLDGQSGCRHLESISLMPVEPEWRAESAYNYVFRFRMGKEENAA